MERITERDEFGNADIEGVDSIDLYEGLGIFATKRVTFALNRLAAYEDLGFTPQEIKGMLKGGTKS